MPSKVQDQFPHNSFVTEEHQQINKNHDYITYNQHPQPTNETKNHDSFLFLIKTAIQEQLMEMFKPIQNLRSYPDVPPPRFPPMDQITC